MLLKKNLLLGALILSLGLLSLIDTNNPNSITGLVSLNDSSCGTCSNWTDIACGETELDTFGCLPEEMYQTRECTILYNPTSSPLIIKLKPLETSVVGLAVLNTEETCSERCVSSTICSNLPPNEPISPFPEDNSEDIPINIELSWDATDPNNDDLIFDLYFGNLSDIDLIASDLNETSYDLANLDYGKFYMWQVIAKDNLTETSSQIWQFRTEENNQKASTKISQKSSSSSNTPHEEETGNFIVEDNSQEIVEQPESVKGLVVVEENPENIAAVFSDLLTGNAIKLITSNNNVLFQLIAIVLTISIIVLFIKKRR